MVEAYYKDDLCSLYLGNTFRILPLLVDKQANMIFADPPYFLSNDGISCKGGHMVSVNKGNWDKGLSLEEKYAFNRRWISLCFQVLSLHGTLWVSGTLHNIYAVGMALEKENFKILNNITWQKTNPPPNLGCRCFTHSTETILWAKKNEKKAKHYFNYALMKSLNGDKQMKDVWTGALTPKSEKTFGKHPTQKPEYILERIILASTKKGDLIIDPFCGSGTTGLVAKRLGRHFIGIDNDEGYVNIAKQRLAALE